ncbi:O-methyltransferase-domain-containing protein [Mycena sp. CBHHK59/15]|nr:O-methyltransferase-domain-containing protein [Mycena sp. CBHHK59/15]
MAAPSPLTALVQIITAGVQTLESAYAAAGIPLPDLSAPFAPTLLDMDPALFAATQGLIAAVRPPMQTVQAMTAGMHTTATLGFVVDADVPDVLAAAGPAGIHVRELAAATGVDADHQARVLRFLATRHVFQEVAPNTFANNRISSMLCKTKSLDEIKADPEAKYDGAPLAAIASSLGDESLKASGYLSEFLRGGGADASAFNTAFKTPKTMWEWREEPLNMWRARRFAVGMKGGGDVFPASIFTAGVAGDTLPADAVVVDVGGSVGSVTLKLAKAFPHLKYVVQDLQKEIAEGEKFWATSAPELVSSGRVSLQVHNFFEPQPVRDAAVYFMRVVIHDWPDAAARAIMANTRAAAGAHSKLVLFDMAPFPLLANMGEAGAGFVTAVDIEMMTVFNGKERTATGWKLEEVRPGMLFGFVYSAV